MTLNGQRCRVGYILVVNMCMMTSIASGQRSQIQNVMQATVRLSTTKSTGTGVLVDTGAKKVGIVSNLHIYERMNGYYAMIDMVEDTPNGGLAAHRVPVNIREVVSVRTFDDPDAQPFLPSDEIILVVGSRKYPISLTPTNNNLKGVVVAINEYTQRAGLKVFASIRGHDGRFRLQLHYLDSISDPDSRIDLLTLKGTSVITTRPLWKKHFDTTVTADGKIVGPDIAVLPFSESAPDIFKKRALPRTAFPTMQEINQVGPRPAQTLVCFGFPYGNTSAGVEPGWALLRTATVAAQYAPSQGQKKFFVGGVVNPGDSGGPCITNSTDEADTAALRVVGLMTDMLVYPQELESINLHIKSDVQFGFGTVTHAVFGREVIDHDFKKE